MLHNHCIIVNRKTIKENYQTGQNYDNDVIGSISNPFNDATGLAILNGNISENGAVIKPSSAAGAYLMKHTGKSWCLKI